MSPPARLSGFFSSTSGHDAGAPSTIAVGVWRMRTRLVRQVAFVTACLCLGACAGQVRPDLSATAPRSEALLVLPGFGYGRHAEHALRELRGQMKDEGFDLYVPSYISRGGLDKSGERLQRFLREQRLDRYDRVH